MEKHWETGAFLCGQKQHFSTIVEVELKESCRY